MTDVLKIEHVTKTYRRRGRSEVSALRDVSLTIPPGAFKVIHGPSGSGKTTLLLAAGGLQEPDTGTVQVAGTDLYAMSPEQRARFRAANIGFVFQQFHLIPYLTVLENVLAPTLAVSGNGARDRAEELIDAFGLSHRLDHPPSELSTGERQRVAMSRALLNEPALLLADEPTGNLDSQNAEAVLKHLHAFAERGGAVMVATHDNRVEADQRYTMDDGVLLDQTVAVQSHPTATQ